MNLDHINQVVGKLQTKMIPILGKIEGNQVFKSMKQTFLYLNYVLLISSVLAILKLINEHFIHQQQIADLSSKLLLLLMDNFGWLFLGILCFLMFQEKGKFHYYLCSAILYLLFSSKDLNLLSISKIESLFFALLALLCSVIIVTGYQLLLRKIKKITKTHMEFLDNILLMIYFSLIFITVYQLLSQIKDNNLGEILGWLNIDNPLMVFVIVFFEMLLWYMGINGYGILSPVVLLFAISNLNANFQSIAIGATPQFIFTPNFWDYFLSVTGSGITGAIVILSLLSKKTTLKKIGQTAVSGTWFSVSEPIVFGIPVVMNSYFFIPFVIGTPILGVIQWFVFKFGWVSIPTYFVADLPLPFSSFFATMDWRSLILTAATIVVATLMYWPFYKAFEKNYVEKTNSDKYQDLDLDF
ncbi:PTS transporter subunit EIIC [Enterococcus canintestini]|uniref:PTS transporter subunit EIIC n=1 Tax=Enterococcus canintestini TaxID=317010 RepID=UPI002891419E|nr:PTS transporter subunit EIIC [Enterococcus canintestini]MDT2739804.1 PTS transporter subunit EIIC [Enterococcus canintestini]